MKGELVTFTAPAWRPFPRNPDLVIEAQTVTAEKSYFGLAVHRSLGVVGERWNNWSVSDPITGALVCRGEFPGRQGAIAALIQLAVAHQHHVGGIRGALQIARQRFLQNEMVVTP